MSKVDIKAWVDAWVAANPKVWEHDRTSTLSASEAASCLRRAWFGKNRAAQADDSDYGFKIRGDLIENHLWLPAIQHAVRQSNSLQLLYAGPEQRTFSSSFTSATPDGLLTGVDRDCLKHLGVFDIGEDHSLVVEAKSADPRLKLLEPKPEHVFQVQVQMGILREVTGHRPDYALISYVNASDHADIKSWPVKFDPDAYAAAKRRARQVMAAETAEDLPAEGRIEGGCKYCDYTGACNAIEADAVPDEVVDELPPVVVKNLGEMVMMEKAWRREKKNAERQLALTQESIRQTLREARTRAAQGSGWSLSYSRIKGRRSLDVKALVEAAKAAGIDVAQFERTGSDSDRLVVRTLGGEEGGDDDE